MRAEASTGDRGDAVQIGGEYDLTEKQSLYGTYTLSTDQRRGEREVFTFGQRARISNQLQVFHETQFSDQQESSGMVNVVYTDGNGVEHDILNVDSAAACHPTDGGWYYDDNNNPHSIHLCPASCDVVSVDGEGKIDILFGCETKIAPPR